MAAQSLYRRYRPRTFSEVRGQDHVIRALRNAVAGRTEGHAYLFSGPRGTGKTSTARLLAKALNCETPVDGEPCGTCESCTAMDAGRSLDIFELDAASNNGVDAVRDLIARASVGSPGKVKVYILDEVHMLSPGASNALLKTLEEPPDHVRFVLATTDPQKVLPTIKSRTQHFEFKLLSAEELLAYVQWVKEDAGLDVDEAALAWTVREGRGSARDTLSALDRVVASGGVVDRTEPTEALLEALATGDPGAAVNAVSEALAQGRDPRVLAEALVGVVRDAFLVSLAAELPHVAAEDRARFEDWAKRMGTALLTRALEQLGAAIVEMRNAPEPRIPLELALVRLTTGGGAPAAGGEGGGGADVSALVTRIERLERALAEVSAGRTGSVPAPPPAPAEVPGRTAPAEPAPVVAEAPAARPAPNPAAPRAGSGSGPAAARAALRATAGGDAPAAPAAPPAAAPAASPAGRPSLGAARARARGEAPPAEPVASGATPAPADQPVPAAPPAPTAAAPAPEVAPAPEATPSQAPAAGGSLPTVEQLTHALSETVLARLKGMAKAIYANARFLEVDDAGRATLAFENVPTRDRAERFRSDVEQELAQCCGRPVPLELVAAGASGGAVAMAPPAAGAAPSATRVAVAEVHDEPEPVELDELVDATDVAVTGVDRIKQAFPGAVEVDPEQN